MGIGELLVNETHHVTHAVEQARHDDVARRALLRQLAQRGRHEMRVAALVGVEHFHQPEIARGQQGHPVVRGELIYDAEPLRQAMAQSST